MSKFIGRIAGMARAGCRGEVFAAKVAAESQGEAEQPSVAGRSWERRLREPGYTG